MSGPRRDDTRSIEADLKLLFRLTEARGRQASGVGLYRHGVISTFKQPERASTMVERPRFRQFLDASLHASPASTDVAGGPTVFIGHCRLTTDGSELDPRNNHPIEVDGIVGVHNGVVALEDDPSPSPTRESDERTDSELIFRALAGALRRSPPNRAIAETYGRMRGSASIALLNQELPALLLATNFGSLFYAHSPEQGVFVFASERHLLREYMRRGQLLSGSGAEPVAVVPRSGLLVDFDTAEPRSFHFAETDEEPATFVRRNAKPFEILHRNPTPDKLRRCTRCILPETYPFLTYDEKGVCSHCRKYERQVTHGRDELEKLLSRYRSKTGEPDILVGLSGGRDSSFGLHLLKEEFGMHPVGFNFDWLLTSHKARRNVAKIAGALGVEVIYRTSDYERDAENIRRNILTWVKDPDLGMLPFVQAADKWMYHYGRQLRKETGLKLTVWCTGTQLEQREFFLGHAGIDKTLRNNQRLWSYGAWTKVQMAVYYATQSLKNPGYLNRSVLDNALNFYHCMVARDDFLYLYEYWPWREEEIERVLREKYAWEADDRYGVNQWRMDDFHTSFINYCYYTLGGFSEFDEFRSHQIREGLISREEAMELASRDNALRLDSLRTFAGLVGFNLEHVLTKIETAPRLYE